MIQVPPGVAELGQSVIVQLGAALALMMPGGALAWKVLRNGRHTGGAGGRDLVASQVRLEAKVEGLTTRQTEAAEQGARAIADLRQDMNGQFVQIRGSIGEVHRRIDELWRGTR